MASNSELQMIRHQGWLGGFSNLLKKENHRWWGTPKWLLQTLIWLVLTNGMLALILWTEPNFDPNMDEASRQAIMEAIPITALETFINILGMVGAIGAAFLGMETTLNEKNSGTAAWVLSKPASRGAFILSKVISNSLGILVTMVIIQVAAGFLQIWLATDKAYPLTQLAGATGMIFVGMFFYLTLSIMLGSISNNRGLVLGVPLLVNLGYQLFIAIGEWVGEVMPWNLTIPVGARPSLVMAFIQGQPLPTIYPLIATALWSILFIAVALWGFSREEF